MSENPYQAPNTPPEESVTSKHRSFRLTSSTPAANEDFVIGTLREAIWFALILQAPLLLMSGLLLDGGMLFRLVVIASVTFWAMTLIIVVRRGPNTPNSDILLVKWGYLPTLLVVCVFWIAGLSFTP